MNGGHSESTPLKIHVVTLFPDMFAGPFADSIVDRAVRKGLVDIRLVPLRPFGVGVHRICDDYPYGGGVGMLMRPEPLVDAVEWCLAHEPRPARVLVTAARGRPLSQPWLEELSRAGHLVLIAGHYEGIDQRVLDVLGAEELSLGPFVLTGGEIPAMAVVDGVVRLLPGALGAEEGSRDDSFSGPHRLVEGPQYTRPPVYRGHAVPDVLLSGDHARIRAWREQQARMSTERLLGWQEQS
ncbi:MAG: tRNA (guanosine(37)-N1)-methyltransferase TrmD [Clostridia bacterium]